MNRKRFFREFLRDRYVAAIMPSSIHLIRRLFRHIDFGKTVNVVELGPGNGIVTKSLLENLGPHSRYTAIERNQNFIDVLEKTGDARLGILRGSAQDMKALLNSASADEADAVIASIPFTYLDAPDRDNLVKDVASILAPGGVFIIFHQYTPLMIPYLKRHFRRVRVEFEVRNVFPCWVMICHDPR